MTPDPSPSKRPTRERRAARRIDQFEQADPARAAAHAYLAHQAESFPDLDIVGPATDHLSPRDAAFAHALCDTTIRHWLTLRHVICRKLKQPFHNLDAGAQATLLAGAAQILYFRSVPAHAAIDAGVEWSKRHVSRGAADLCNAVLRRVSDMVDRAPRAPTTIDQWLDALAPGQTQAPDHAVPEPLRYLLPTPEAKPPGDDPSHAPSHFIRLLEPVLPPDALSCLAIATSHPTPLIKSWIARHTFPIAARIALHSLCRPPTLVFSPVGEIEPLVASGAPLAPHSSPRHAVYTGPRADLSTFLAAHPGLWIQDPSSTAAISAARHLRPALIIDLCAGQGTKTRQLAATFPQATIIATDTDPRRFAALEAAFANHPRVRVAPFDQVRAQFAERADLVVLDVPCSNTGVLARRVEARYRDRQAQLGRLVPIQRDIIAAGVALLRRPAETDHPEAAPAILYTTCSMEHDENDAQLRTLTRAAPPAFRIEIERAEQILPQGLPGDEPGVYRDASYHALARLRRIDLATLPAPSAEPHILRPHTPQGRVPPVVGDQDRS